MLDSGKSIIVTSGQLTTSFWHGWGISLHYILQLTSVLPRSNAGKAKTSISPGQWTDVKAEPAEEHPQWGQ